MEAAEDMFASPAELEGGAVDGAKADGEAGEGGVDAVAPLPVDLVCNGVWRPVQQARFSVSGGVVVVGDGVGVDGMVGVVFVADPESKDCGLL